MRARQDGRPSKLTPKELIELCENCPYDDCVDDMSGCPAYKARARSLKEENAKPSEDKAKPSGSAIPTLDITVANKKEEPPAIPPIKPIVVDRSPTRSQLAGYNAAIAALERANEVTDTQKFNLPEVKSIIEQLKVIRFTWFAELVDWDIVAKSPAKGVRK